MSQSRHRRGLCRECGREISLTKPGNVRVHGSKDRSTWPPMNCRGSGEPPRQDGEVIRAAVADGMKRAMDRAYSTDQFTACSRRVRCQVGREALAPGHPELRGVPAPVDPGGAGPGRAPRV